MYKNKLLNSVEELACFKLRFLKNFKQIILFFAALRSANPDGNFYINGELKSGRPDPSQSYRVAGTTFRYSRPYKSLRKGETLLADGPTSEALEVLVRLVNR